MKIWEILLVSLCAFSLGSAMFLFVQVAYASFKDKEYDLTVFVLIGMLCIITLVLAIFNI